MKIIFLILIVVFIGCKDKKDNRAIAKAKADSLLEAIAKGEATILFPEKYFPKSQTVSLMKALKDTCDFSNRRGGFINTFSQKNLAENKETINLVYEYYLKCDYIRFTITYFVDGTNLNLYQFSLSPVDQNR